MPMIVGDSGCTTGLAKRIFDARVAAAETIGLDTSGDQAALRADCFAIATAVYNEITTNATLVVSAGIAVATTGTAAAQTGVTTAPGTGTVT